MSNSIIEVPTGELGLRRRNRLLFGVCLLLFLAVVFLVASLWLHSDRAEKQAVHEKRTMGRLLVDQMMLNTHWQALETIDEFQEVLTELSESLSSQEHESWILRPVSPDGLGAPQDEFERKVLDRYSKPKPSSQGQVEFMDRFVEERSVYQYYQPVRARKRCLRVCHAPLSAALKTYAGDLEPAVAAQLGNAPPLEDGDLMAVVMIEFPYVPPR